MIRGRTGIFNKLCAMLILGLAFAIACGCNPKVMHSMMAPETAQIQVWKIVLGMNTHQTDTSLAVAQFNREFSSELANEQYYREYTEQVGEELAGLGHHLISGPISEGVILVKPVVEKRQTVAIGPEYNQRLVAWNRMEQEEAPANDQRARRFSDQVRPTDYVKPVYHHSDAVRNVYIEIIGPGSRFLGSIGIDGNKVKPEFVAEVLDRLIREGKW